MIKTILLDFNNTLTFVDSEKKKEVMESFNITPGENEMRHEIYLIYSKGIIKSDEEYLNYLQSVLKRKSPLTIKYLDSIHETEEIRKSTIELLIKLKQSYKICLVANNVRSWVIKKLKKYNIDKFFNEIIISSDIGIRKPDPRIFTYALKKINSKPEECIFISDELNEDLTGAKILGIKTVWTKREKEKQTFQPDFTINSLEELEKILERL
jgi:HAD superfamily hydrolase (TIGR01549 family)